MPKATEKTNPKIPEPVSPLGVGYLYHYDPVYKDFADRFKGVGGIADIYEILGVQFNSEPATLTLFADSLGKPVTLHSYEYCLGNAQRPSESTLRRIQQLAKNANAAYIGEHVAVMGTRDQYCGAFFTPPGTDEQTKVLVENIIASKKESYCPIIIENPSSFCNQVGPRSIGAQMREVSVNADVGILLSLSNVSISEAFVPQDRDAFLGEIPMSRVRQIHLICGNEAEEKMPGMQSQKREQEWAISTLKQLAQDCDCKPASVIFELEAGTPSLTEPERLRDLMEMTRELFGFERVSEA